MHKQSFTWLVRNAPNSVSHSAFSSLPRAPNHHYCHFSVGYCKMIDDQVQNSRIPTKLKLPTRTALFVSSCLLYGEMRYEYSYTLPYRTSRSKGKSILGIILGCTEVPEGLRCSSCTTYAYTTDPIRVVGLNTLCCEESAYRSAMTSAQQGAACNTNIPH